VKETKQEGDRSDEVAIRVSVLGLRALSLQYSGGGVDLTNQLTIFHDSVDSTRIDQSEQHTT
jgi:hypothetical protein